MKKTLIAAMLSGFCLSAQANSYFLVVPMPGKALAAANVNVTLSPSASLPTAFVGVPYEGVDFKTLLQVTGDPSFTGSGVQWSVAGTLPAGLHFDSTTGVLSGTATESGVGEITVTASYRTKTGEEVYQVQSVLLTVSLAPATLPRAVVGQPYSYDLKPLLSASGDEGFTPAQATWEIVSGALPQGLQLTSEGTISGTPVSATPAEVTLKATYRTLSGTQTYQLLTLSVESLLLLHFDGNAQDAAASRTVYAYGAAPTFVADGRFGQSARFNGGGHFCTPPFDLLDPVTSNFTIELWAKPSSLHVGALVTHHTYGSALAFYFYMLADGSLSIAESPHGSVRARSAAGVIQANVWQHVALVRDSGSLVGYVNGSEVFRTTNTDSSFYRGGSGYGNLAIGGGACNRLWEVFNGELDEVRISRGARYSAPFAPPAAPGT